MPTELTDSEIRHLGMIQDVIKRLADNSFSVKRWTLVAVGALIALAVRDDTAALAFVGVGLAVAFWGLDSYYLRQERIFRRLYDKVRTEPSSVEPFAMWTPGLVSSQEGYKPVMFSITELLTYAPPAFGGLIVGIYLILY